MYFEVRNYAAELSVLFAFGSKYWPLPTRHERPAMTTRPSGEVEVRCCEIRQLLRQRHVGP
jgi:hypothetical protein